MGAYPDSNPDTCDLCHSPFNHNEEGGRISAEVLACGSCYGKLRVTDVPYVYLVYVVHPLGYDIEVWREYPQNYENGEGELNSDIHHITIASPQMHSETSE